MKFLVALIISVLTPAILKAQEVAPPTPESRTISVWNLIQSGGWAMVPLAILSILAVMFVVVFLFTMRRGSILTQHYMNTAEVLLKKRDHSGFLAISARHSEAIARVMQRVLDFMTKNPNASFESIREIAQTEGAAYATSLQHRVIYLADIGVLAPMVGLFGTVLGIIKSFGVMATNTQVPRPMLLAAGVSEALVATAAGLILGIIAMGFYAIFRGRAQTLISDLESGAAHLMGLIALNLSAKREPSHLPEQRRIAVEDEF
jgi:biopolymer transport protein ExbB